MGTLDKPGKVKPATAQWGGGTTPFRYPGGKGFLAKVLQEKIKAWVGEGAEYAEPFAGGAGAAIRLLADETVSRVRINDADIRIFSAWEAMLVENERFLETLDQCDLSMEQWYRCADLVRNPQNAKSRFDLGFATFFLNRTNRSGIILGAGPIGGYEQKGTWKLDARFNKTALSERIAWLGERSNRIIVTQRDGISFLREASRRRYAARTFFFIDPPYVAAGSRLYLNAMTDRKHERLASFLQAGAIPHWLVTYDQCPLIDDAYNQSGLSIVEVPYSLQARRTEGERLVVPSWRSETL